MPAEQTLIRVPGPLLDEQGRLTTAGWSPQPMLDCNLEKAHFYRLRWLQKLRIKRWDYYGLTTPTHFYSFTLSDIGYLGLVFAYVIDLQTRQIHEETLTLPLARGVRLPRNSQSGEASYDNGRVALRFQVKQRKRHLSVRWPDFGGQGLSAEVDLAQPPEHESITVVIPIRGQRFYYNRKINCLPANGWVEHQGKRETLDPLTCQGNVDWGRGVWEYSGFWVWASASGRVDGQRCAGLNLGFGFGDTSAATENALILDSRVHKLGQVDFEYSSGHFMQPWRMTSPDGRLRLEFTPFFERVAKTDAKLLYSEVHQMFGHYNGCVVSDQGEELQIHNLVGFAEEHHARW